MITAKFVSDAEGLTGFIIGGHSETAPRGRDIVCAAVSSAVMTAANTITEIMDIPAKVSVKENEVSLSGCREKRGREVLAGLKLQLDTVAGDHAEAIKVITVMED